MKISTGDVFQIYSSYGLGFDYASRQSVRMKDEVDGDILETALRNTEKRYPYMSLRLRRNEKEYFWEENKNPVALLHTDGRIHLNDKETNYHVWAVCYKDDWIFIDFYHGIADGTGRTHVIATLLYYYCNLRYGVTDCQGIRTLENPILPEETIDPLDALPSIDVTTLTPPKSVEAFSPIHDGGLPQSSTLKYDILLPEKEFVEFSSAHDGSPGIMLSLLLDRAIDSVFPQRDKPIVTPYVINCRPILNSPESHHNCISAAPLIYTDRLKSLPLSAQATIYRGRTFLACEEDILRPQMTAMASYTKHILETAPSIEEKKSIFAGILQGSGRSQTCMVSYVGRWKYSEIGDCIEEFWIHAPEANDFFAGVTAVNGHIGLSILQKFADERILGALFEQLDEHGISYELKRKMPLDVAYFPEPE